MKCTKCGSELQEDQKFCTVCGTKIEYEKRCPNCDIILEKNQKFCPNCGRELSQNHNFFPEHNTDGQFEKERDVNGIREIDVFEKLKEIGKNLKKKLGYDDVMYNGITKLSDDEYRNGLAVQAKIMEAGYLIAGFIIIKSAWNFRDYYGWKGGIIGFLISELILSAIFWILGAEKYFGISRLKKYDKIKKASSKDAAVIAMENKKAGVIRIVLIVLMLTIGTFKISNSCCEALAEDMQNYDSESKGYTFVTDTENDFSEPQSQEQQDIGSKTFQVGEAVKTNQFEFTVKDAYILDYLGEGKKIPEGAVYAVIEYEYKNISGQPISSWDLPTVKLEDGNGAIYNEDADAQWYFSNDSDAKVISEMNPGIKVKDSKIFEVAVEVLNQGGMKARVDADWYFLVGLNLSYEAAPVYGQNEYMDSLTVESVINTIYTSNNYGIDMEIFDDTDKSVYINFRYDGELLWSGELTRMQSLNSGGICLMFNGTSYITNAADYIEVEWSSAEAQDFPSVYCQSDPDILSDLYGYYGMID